MSTKNTFDGLQFRIMETLEKQPHQAPLTALEIAERLHDTEYRTEMKDNVVFKVANAVHAMKAKGKIIVTDARDKEGRLTYQLPQRLKFPPVAADGGKPANPVLTPELAEKIKTVEPKAASKPVKRQVEGIQNKIIALLNDAPYPLTSPEIYAKLGHLYVDNNVTKDPARIKMLLAGALHYLSRTSKRIFIRPAMKGGQGIKFEYYTRKTGKEPRPGAAPVVVKAKPTSKVTAPPAAAPKPSQAWPEQPNVFRPGAKKVELVQFNIDVPLEKREAWKAAAVKFGVPINQFVTDAIDFAMAHAD